MKKPMINKELCSGCGNCAMLCPEVFFIGADGLSSVIPSDKYAESEIREAVAGCPGQAISWTGKN